MPSSIEKWEARQQKRDERAANRAAPGGKLAEARLSLPEELRGTFDALVADYQFAATMRNRHPFYSPHIIADLVRAGWRRVESGT